MFTRKCHVYTCIYNYIWSDVLTLCLRVYAYTRHAICVFRVGWNAFAFGFCILIPKRRSWQEPKVEGQELRVWGVGRVGCEDHIEPHMSHTQYDSEVLYTVCWKKALLVLNVTHDKWFHDKIYDMTRASCHVNTMTRKSCILYSWKRPCWFWMLHAWHDSMTRYVTWREPHITYTICGPVNSVFSR